MVLSTFASAAGLDELSYVILLPDVERCVARVATREGHGFADVPATRKMHAEFAGAHIDRRHVLFDPPGRPEDVADLIDASQRDGSLTHRCE